MKPRLNEAGTRALLAGKNFHDQLPGEGKIKMTDYN